MGAEATCTATFKRRRSAGKARLETETLEFRGGDLKLSIPLKTITRVAVRRGRLALAFAGSTASFDLGAAAAKWAERIQHPPSRLEKIGAKPDWKVSVIGILEEPFLKELEGAVSATTVGRTSPASDAIFFGAAHGSELQRLDALKRALKPNGALWVIRPKGMPEISEAAVMAAGKRAGLVDVKVVAFSPTHTAQKFVIPLSQRPRK